MLFLTILLCCSCISFSQDINYSIPNGYERDISKDDYKKLVDLALPIIAKRYSIDFVKRGSIQVKDDGHTQTFNLHNLILKCVAISDRALWENIIRDHFEKIFASVDEQKKIDPANYESIKNYLSLRIYPASAIARRGGPSALVSRTDLEGTYTLLMLDLPGAFTSVQRKIFDTWKKDSAAVFAAAMQNINNQKIEKTTRVFEFEKNQIEISFLGNDDYAASYALDLQHNSPELLGEWGAAVSLPNKGLVDICKISSDKPVDFVKFIQMTKPVIEKSYQEHPQAISDQFYWYYKGAFTKINVSTDANGAINVIAPFGLTELLTKKQ